MNVQEFVMSGHPVFPCEGKVPVKGWKWTEITITSHADPRLKQFQEWSWPTQNWLVVFDIDHPEHWPYGNPDALLKQHAGQRTQSGGYHLVMIDTNPDPDHQPAQIRHPWGEIRRRGTYHRLYEPNPNWLHKNYLPVPEGWETGAHKKPLAAPEEQRPGVTLETSQGGNTQYKCLVVTDDITTPAQEGSRNIRLTSYVGALHKRGTPWLEMVEKAQALNSSYEPPLAEDEVLAICRSVARYPAGNPQAQFPASFQPGSNSTAQTARYYLSASEVQAGDFPQPQMWLDCWGSEQAVMLHGPSGSGKSLFMLDRLLRMRQVRTLVIDAEMPMSTIKARLGRTAADHLYWLSKEHVHEWNVLDLEGWEHVVLDTKAALYSHPESENSMEHWAPLNKWLRHWCDQGTCISLLHHSNADATKARGSTNAITAMDSELSIRGFEVGGNKFWTVKQQKDRHGLTLPQRWFKLHQAEGGNMVFGEVENPEI